MTKILDRPLAFYVLAFLVCLAGMLSLFLAADLLANLDDIADKLPRGANLVGAVCVHFGARIVKIFVPLAVSSAVVAALLTAVRHRLVATGGPRR